MNYTCVQGRLQVWSVVWRWNLYLQFITLSLFYVFLRQAVWWVMRLHGSLTSKGSSWKSVSSPDMDTAVMVGRVTWISHFSSSILSTATYPICPNMALILSHIHIYIFTFICSLENFQTMCSISHFLHVYCILCSSLNSSFNLSYQ